MRNESQISEINDQAKAYHFGIVQHDAALDQLGLDGETSLTEFARLGNLIFALDCVSLSRKEKDLGCDALSEIGVTNVDTQSAYVEQNYWEEGYSQ